MRSHVWCTPFAPLVTLALLCGCSDEDRVRSGSGGSAAMGDPHGSGGAGSGPDATPGSGGAEDTREDLGEGDGKDVVMIGDSWMNYLITGLQQSLVRVSGRDYRRYGVPGAFMIDGAIPGQYAKAVSEDADIKTVVMSGGGNDILGSTCDGACEPLIDDVLARIWTLTDQMGADGVLDVIIVGYAYVSTKPPPLPEGVPVPPSPRKKALDAALDYQRGAMLESCRDDGPPPRCHFVDPVKELDGRVSGTHPDPEGFDILGRMVWERMKTERVRR
jgi:hypothetical protein